MPPASHAAMQMIKVLKWTALAAMNAERSHAKSEKRGRAPFAPPKGMSMTAVFQVMRLARLH